MRRGTLGCRFVSRWVAIAIAVAVVPIASGYGQEAPTPSREPVGIEILGASVSAGFVDSAAIGGSADNATVPLVTVLKHWFEEQEVAVRSRADALMFLDVERRGAQQIERCKKQGPSLVVAVDFLFWYGYGSMRGSPDEVSKLRLRRLEEGLALLDQLPCNLLIADLPDMRGASDRMLRPAQIPSVEDLAAMNKAIVAFAGDRPRVRVFPLGATVAEMKEKGVSLRVGEAHLATSPGALLQTDRLHANRLGMAYLGHRLQPLVRELLPQAVRETLPEHSFVDFCTFAEANVELEDCKAKAASRDSARDPSGKDGAKTAGSGG